MKCFATGVLAFALLAPGLSVAQAGVWDRADALFEQRAGDRGKIAEARAEYLHVLDQVSTKEDLIYGVTRLGRLAVYEGEMMLPRSATEERKAIFAPCWQGYVEKISPDAIGEDTVQYWYFKSVCLAYWAQASDPLVQARYIGDLSNAIEKALSFAPEHGGFEGGGVYRIASAFKSDSAVRAFPSYYDPEEALELANNALQAPPYGNIPHPGSRYYLNFYVKALAQKALDQIDAAKETLRAGIARVERAQRTNTLPSGWEPESNWALDVMKAMQAEL